MKILLVEDDESLAEGVKEALINQHYLVDLATNGQAGWQLAESFEYDLILLDLILPKLDGISFCQQRRKRGDRTPILLLTAQDSSTNKVAGLDAGADDYLVKPFDWQELFARIRALLRRGNSPLPPVLEWHALCLDPSNCQVTYNGQLVHLTAKEYALLELFLRNPHRIFSQSALLDHLWSFEEPPSENAVRAHIKALRQKLKKAGAQPDLIETIYGLGYRLKLRESELKSQKRERGGDKGTRGQGDKGTRGQGDKGTRGKLSNTPGLTAIWERHRQKYVNRIAVIEKAVTALREDNLSETLHKQALREAHTLAGSLGSFGFREASDRSREIEQIFQSGESEMMVARLSELVMVLGQELETGGRGAGGAGEAEEAEGAGGAGGAGEEFPTLGSGGVSHPQLPLTSHQSPRLLIVDDDFALAQALGAEATAWGMRSEVAGNLSQAREALARTRPDVVLLDLCFPDSTENGFALLGELTSADPPVPVLVFTGQESFADRVKVARLGGRGFLQKPISTAQVIEAIAQVLQQASPKMAKLLIVDDDPQMLDLLRTLLEPWGFDLTLLDDPKQFWKTLEQSAPDLLILDVEMPNLSGIDLCQVVRHDPRWNNLPVLLLSAYTDGETVQRGFTAGADDYVQKPIVEPELVARVLSRLERTQTQRLLMEVDPLTGVTNRRRSVQELTRLLHLAKRQNQSLSLIILDLDRFKLISDRHGREAGDRVLKRLGKLLGQTFRIEDVVARWGGEKFVVGLYGMIREQGVKRLAKLQETWCQYQFRDANDQKFSVTLSGGVAEYPIDGSDLKALYQAAEASLYPAKAEWRNPVFPAHLR